MTATRERGRPASYAPRPSRPRKPKKSRGRRSLLTPEVQAAIVKSLQAGVFQEMAAHSGGIEVCTYFSWLSRGRTEKERRESGGSPDRKESIYVNFVDAVSKARAMAVTRAVASIQKAGLDGDWKAFVWWLSHSYPEQYRRELPESGRRDGQLDYVPATFEVLPKNGEKIVTSLPIDEESTLAALHAVLEIEAQHAERDE